MKRFSIFLILIFLFSLFPATHVHAKDIELKLLKDSVSQKSSQQKQFADNTKGFFADLWNWLTGGHNNNNNNNNNGNSSGNNGSSSSGSSAPAANERIGVVTASNLRLRTGPSTSYPTVNSYPLIPRGTRVALLSQENGWGRIRVIHNNAQGYSSLQYIDFSSSPASGNSGNGNSDTPAPGSNTNPGSTASTRSFIYVQPEYIHASENFARPDMTSFGNHLSGTFKYHIKGKDAVRASLVPNTKIDYVYFAGHGYGTGNQGYPVVPEWRGNSATNKAFLPRDFPRNKRNNVNNYVFASCKSVRKNWKDAFSGGSLKSVVGYLETGYAGRTLTLVMEKFATRLKTISPTDSCAIANAWAAANQQASSQTGSAWARERWAAVAYDRQGRLCYWNESNTSVFRGGSETRSAASDEVIPPSSVITRAQGTIKIFSDDTSRSRSLDEELYSEFTTEYTGVPENIDNITINSGATRSAGADSSNLIKMDSGAIIYASGNIDAETIQMTQQEAIEKAWAFVEDNGGMPAGAKFDHATELTKEYLDSNEKVTVGYVIHFVHDFNGKNIVSYDGEGIVVTVQNSGVTNYQRMWTNIQEKPADTRSGSQEKPKMLSVSECIQRAADDILDEMKYTELNELNIVNSELTYMTSSIDKKDRVLKQVYCVTADSGHFFLLDPYTGELVK